MECFKVINPGLFTSVQDMGRFGYERQGVPVSGVMDEFSFRVANMLVGNAENTPALEITLLGPTLEVLQDTVVAVTGAWMRPVVDGREMPCWSSFPVRKGETLSFAPVKAGCRAYMAVLGGFAGDTVMGSVSTYTRGGIGGVKGRRLEKGDILSREGDEFFAHFFKVREEYIPHYSSEEEIRIILGPQHDYFSRESLELFLNSTYTITKDADRMGYRLDGPEIKAKEKHDIITDGILPGAVQIPGNGKPIIMLKDAQTTGGYAKIATVVSTDLSKLAQLKPGDRINFRAISLQEAHQLLQKMEYVLDDIRKTLVPSRYFDVTVDGTVYNVNIELLK
ncbi:MAG TPA: biotin-dependent carboxyltransferase [Thermoanaerobacterales bacterium]|nr:biotin-dependent carboxyltransferase [Thermoanaerobacterales bacterium]